MRQLIENVALRSFRNPGELIKYTRKNLGISQRALAHKVKMSPSALSKIESGHTIMPRKAIQISVFLKINPSDLISFDIDKPKTLSKSTEQIKKMFPDWREAAKELIKELN
jgi:transcriptional regulator with XRE-family HTH domain